MCVNRRRVCFRAVGFARCLDRDRAASHWCHWGITCRRRGVISRTPSPRASMHRRHGGQGGSTVVFVLSHMSLSGSHGLYIAPTSGLCRMIPRKRLECSPALQVVGICYAAEHPSYQVFIIITLLCIESPVAFWPGGTKDVSAAARQPFSQWPLTVAMVGEGFPPHRV